MEIRQKFIVPEGKVLLGVDASAIQLRILAHFIGDEEYIHEVCDGDPHTVHMDALGGICKTRDNSKTFFYAWLLGAGIGRVASILGCSMKEAKLGMESFFRRIPGLGVLKNETIPEWAERGWMYGLDGRRMKIASQHLALASALQGNEKSIMAVANVLWDTEARKRGIDFKLVAFTHDDWETEVADTPGMAEELGALQVSSIVKAGEILNMKCPLDGTPKYGRSWFDVH
jgi:DNA polymerase I-like protein with 3'-5' exonuclease and polymerase domains